MDEKPRIREFIRGNLVVFDKEVQFSDEDNFFELGMVDSPFAIQLIALLEEEFDIEVLDEDLDIANFNSVERIAAYVRRKRSG